MDAYKPSWLQEEEPADTEEVTAGAWKIEDVIDDNSIVDSASKYGVPTPIYSQPQKEQPQKGVAGDWTTEEEKKKESKE
eukprot:2352207-Pyramimonas_sp.AAC.1